MSTVLTNGIIIPDNGNRNWGGDLANNWNIIDVNIGYMTDVKNRVTTLENSVAENSSNIEINTSNISALQTSKQDVIEDLDTIRSGASAGATAVQPSALNNYVDLSSEQTISGAKTFSNIITSNKELQFKDTTFDWSDTSLNTWCDAGHVSWFDRTGARRMHELAGVDNGIWNKSCYINENLYFSVNSNREMRFEGNSFKFNNKNIDAIEEEGDFYIRYSNGFQICWGHFLGITNTPKTISYAKPFSDSASISVNGQGGIYATFDLWTNSSFNVLSTTSSAENAWFLWLAVGRWK